MAQTAVVRPSLAPVPVRVQGHSQGHSRRHLRFPTSAILWWSLWGWWRSGFRKNQPFWSMKYPLKNKRFFFAIPQHFWGVPIWQKIHVSHLLFSWNLEGNEPCYLLAYEATQSKTNSFFGDNFWQTKSPPFWFCRLIEFRGPFTGPNQDIGILHPRFNWEILCSNSSIAIPNENSNVSSIWMVGRAWIDWYTTSKSTTKKPEPHFFGWSCG